jgi:hypothetical protein
MESVFSTCSAVMINSFEIVDSIAYFKYPFCPTGFTSQSPTGQIIHRKNFYNRRLNILLTPMTTTGGLISEEPL